MPRISTLTYVYLVMGASTVRALGSDCPITFGVQHMPLPFGGASQNKRTSTLRETKDLMSYFVSKVRSQLDASHRLL
jgi:hypothetical protein